jgi:hypothetical protein
MWINETHDFLECALETKGKPLADSVVRAGFKNKINYTEDITSILHNRTRPHVWVKNTVAFTVETSSRLNYVERFQVRYAQGGICGARDDISRMARHEFGGNHLVDTHVDQVWDVVSSTQAKAPFKDAVKPMMQMCMESSSGIKLGGSSEYLWSPVAISDWDFHIDNQRPFVNLTVRYEEVGRSTGAWILNWTAHDYTGSQLCCVISIWKVNNAVTVCDVGNLNFNIDSCPKTLVCRGPYNETVADNWFAMHDSRYSFDYGAFEKKDAYSGGCRYVEDPRTGRVHCFIIEAEDSARADWPVTDTRGNLGYFRQCVAEPVGSPAVTLVLVLALLVGLAAARRR